MELTWKSSMSPACIDSELPAMDPSGEHLAKGKDQEDETGSVRLGTITAAKSGKF